MKAGSQGFLYCSHPGRKKTRQLLIIQLTTTMPVGVGFLLACGHQQQSDTYNPEKGTESGSQKRVGNGSRGRRVSENRGVLTNFPLSWLCQRQNPAHSLCALWQRSGTFHLVKPVQHMLFNGRKQGGGQERDSKRNSSPFSKMVRGRKQNALKWRTIVSPRSSPET